MNKIKSLKDLKLFKSKLQTQINLDNNLIHIKIAMSTCGIASGAKQIMDFFKEELEKRNIESIISYTGCMSYCYAEPTIEVKIGNKEPVVFGYVDLKKADDIIEKYIKKGELISGIIPKDYTTI